MPSLPAINIWKPYAIRAALLWLGARGMFFFVLAMAGAPSGIRLTAIAAVWVVFVTIALVRVDIIRRHEVALLANLGVSNLALLPVVAVPPIIAEIVMRIGLGPA
jgi:hypothetical protein